MKFIFIMLCYFILPIFLINCFYAPYIIKNIDTFSSDDIRVHIIIGVLFSIVYGSTFGKFINYFEKTK